MDRRLLRRKAMPHLPSFLANGESDPEAGARTILAVWSEGRATLRFGFHDAEGKSTIFILRLPVPNSHLDKAVHQGCIRV